MALPMALILLVVASFIVVPGLWATGSMLKINHDMENDNTAYYAAKAGIADAYWRFKNPEMARSFPYPLDNPVNNMTVNVSQVSKTVVGSTTTYVIKSAATLNSKLWSTVYASIDVNSGSGYPFDYAIASTDGNIEIHCNAHVNSIPTNGQANVFANGELNVDTCLSADVNGTGYYTTGTPDCRRITGGCTKKTAVVFQELDISWYWAQAERGNALPSPPACWPTKTCSIPTTYGATTYTIYGGTAASPTYLGQEGKTSYIDGNLELDHQSGGKERIILRGVVWVNGNISIEGGTYIYTDPSQQCYLLAHGGAVDHHSITLVTNSKIMSTTNNLNLISDNGDITIESGVDGPTIGAPVLLGVFYAPNGAIIVNSNSDVIASAVLGKSVKLESNVTINYDTALRDNPPDGFEINVTSVKMTGYSGQ